MRKKTKSKKILKTVKAYLRKRRQALIDVTSRERGLKLCLMM
jgi:hypothetical protein